MTLPLPLSPSTRYRKWTLNEDDEVDIICRCEVDGVINNKGEDQLMSIKAFNEFDMRAQVCARARVCLCAYLCVCV